MESDHDNGDDDAGDQAVFQSRDGAAIGQKTEKHGVLPMKWRTNVGVGRVTAAFQFGAAMTNVTI